MGAGMVHTESASNTDALAGKRMITARLYHEDPRVWAISSRVKRAWKLQIRKASCYCSARWNNAFDDCKVAINSVNPGLVGGMRTEVI